MLLEPNWNNELEDYLSHSDLRIETAADVQHVSSGLSEPTSNICKFIHLYRLSIEICLFWIVKVKQMK